MSNPCVIGEQVHIRGRVSGSGTLEVRGGQIDGEINLTDGSVVIDAGRVGADIKAQDLTVNGGDVEGTLDIIDLLTIAAGASVRGDITAQEIEIRDGALFSGRLLMDVELPEGL